MSQIEKKELERIRYWQGQVLRSRDFRNNQEVEEQRRWWHNRAEHRAFGVSSGLTPVAIGPEENITAVQIMPGLAYDCFGRELILEQPRIIPVPADASLDQFTGSLILVMSYAATKANAHENSVCWTPGKTTPAVQVEFFWRPQESFRFEDGVPVAKVNYQPTSIRKLDIDFFRPPPRPKSRPLIATGATIEGKTPWQTQHLASSATETLIEVSVEVNTSSAGFTSVPCYFAWLEGPIVNPKTLEVSRVLLTGIRNETADRFTFLYWFAKPLGPVPPVGPLVMVSGLTSGGASLSAVALPPPVPRPDFYVSWMGCQMPPVIPFVPMGARTSNRAVSNVVLNI